MAARKPAADKATSDDTAQDLAQSQEGSTDEAQDALTEAKSTDGPGAVYFGRRQRLRNEEGMSSAEVNAIEADLKEQGKLYDPNA